jgi:hypothetical protein
MRAGAACEQGQHAHQARTAGPHLVDFIHQLHPHAAILLLPLLCMLRLLLPHSSAAGADKGAGATALVGQQGLGFAVVSHNLQGGKYGECLHVVNILHISATFLVAATMPSAPSHCQQTRRFSKQLCRLACTLNLQPLATFGNPSPQCPTCS